MPNSYFEFKKFTIRQDQCAMKVSTLACIFGAAIQFQEPKLILDIGTGTGLLSLMLAQRFPDSKIDALEIESNAYHQANANVSHSLWKERIQVIQTDFLKWKPENKYDLIISNPPFFKDHLKSPHENITLARHNEQLSPEKMVDKVTYLLNENGSFWVLLPCHETNLFKNFALQRSLFINYQMNILNIAGQLPKAVISKFSKSNTAITTDELIIKKNSLYYSDHFVELLKDFYLHL